MKFVLGGILHESNTFCPRKTPLYYFDVTKGDDVIKEHAGSKWFLGGVIDAAKELGVDLHPTIAATANPYGVVDGEAYGHLSSELRERIGEAGAFDGVVLCLHGGMVAEGSLDPEGEILQGVRDTVGHETPIVCTLDMHCNVSERMVESADAFFANNENPHFDSYDRGVEATKALYRIVRGEIRPVMALKKPGMLPPTLHVNPPHSGPLVNIFERAFEMEGDPRVINVNIGAGFPWCDTPDAGMSVISVVDGDEGLAEEIAEELSERLWEARQEFIPSLPTVDEAVERAMRAEEGLVILADVADNPGDGTTEDSNGILKALIERDAEDVGMAVMCDPEAVEQCVDAGMGNEVTLDLGCKARLFEEPITLTVKVRTITDGAFQTHGPLFGGHEVDIGRTVVVEHDSIGIIITGRTHNPTHPEVFRRHGIEPSRKKILVVKTFRMHMEPNYRPFAKDIIEVDAPGQASVNMKSFEWTRIPRPMFPIDDL
jgi:microcystin degradation protein MlrC